uniref:uncharacterized protein n=1 Tax=Pristiophorus japonicus TaxID=55135 RepID=UPI00398E43EF
MVVRGGMQQKMPPRASSFHKLMACRCLLLYFFWFHTGKVVFGAEFTFCGYLHHSINKSHHHIEPGPGPCSLNVSINQAGLRIKARLIENGPPICTEDIATTTPDGLSDVCITWKGHVGKLFITRGDVVKSYSTAMSTNWKCCQNFILTGSTSSNNSPLLNDIIYINGSHFSPVHIENASYLEFTGSEGACETPWSDCIKQNDKLTQLTTQSTFTLTDARYAVLIVNGILEECNASISVNLGSDLRKVLMNMNFPEDSKTFVTPNVKAAVIKVNQRSNFEFGVTANFSWVDPDDQPMIAAVQVTLTYQLRTSPKVVVTQFMNKTSFQGEERSPVSPNIIVKVGNLSIDDLTSPLTLTFHGVSRWEPNPTLCRFLDSGQTVNLNGCNSQTGNNNITCKCDHLGFFFAVTLESKDIFDIDFGQNDDLIKVTTWSNHSTNVSVTTPEAHIPCETYPESTTSISSSPGWKQSCSYLQHSLTVRDGNESPSGAVTKVTSLIQRCFGQISTISSIISYLENIFMEIHFEGESEVGETEYIAFYILKINTENFTGVEFPNPDTRNLSTLDPAIKIELPPTLLHNSSNHFNTTTSRIIFTIYKNTSLFQGHNNSTVLNNLVVGIKVVNVTIKNLKYPVIIEFQNVSLPNQSVGKCVFWDFKTGSTSSGDWSEAGCTTETEFNNITCKCDHLTHFAVLLGHGSDSTSPSALANHYIALIACGAFIIFVVVTIYCNKNIRKLSQRSVKQAAGSRSNTMETQ